MKAIRHMGIVVSNLEPALDFYTGLLGLKVIKRADESGEYLDKVLGLKNVAVSTIKMAADDGNLVELLYFQSHSGKPAKNRKICDNGLTHIAFTVEDVNAEYERLSNAGVPFNSLPQKSADGYAWIAFCRDPEGNFIELVEMLN